LDLEVPGDVGHEVAHRRERLQRLEHDRHVEGEIAEPGHAHEGRDAPYLRPAPTPPSRPAGSARAHGPGPLGPDAGHRVEDDHAAPDLGRVVLEAALAALATPDAEHRAGHVFCSSITCFSSAGSGVTGTFSTPIWPSTMRTTRLKPSPSLLFSGKSSR